METERASEMFSYDFYLKKQRLEEAEKEPFLGRKAVSFLSLDLDLLLLLPQHPIGIEHKKPSHN